MTVHEFSAGRPASLRPFRAECAAVREIGRAGIRVTKSQIAFAWRRAFAWAWIPGSYLHGDTALLVLSVALRLRDRSPCWKEIVQPAQGRFTHHLELRTASDIDERVRGWPEEARAAAGQD